MALSLPRPKEEGWGQHGSGSSFSPKEGEGSHRTSGMHLQGRERNSAKRQKLTYTGNESTRVKAFKQWKYSRNPKTGLQAAVKWPSCQRFTLELPPDYNNSSGNGTVRSSPPSFVHTSWASNNFTTLCHDGDEIPGNTEQGLQEVDDKSYNCYKKYKRQREESHPAWVRQECNT